MTKKYKTKTEKYFCADVLVDSGKSYRKMQAKLNQLGSQGWKEISRNTDRRGVSGGIGEYITVTYQKEINIKKPKNPKKSKPDYLKEITVLLDLLEDDTLSKDVFIKKMRQKLK